LSGETDVPDVFGPEYYDRLYFADPQGKRFRRPNGSVDRWGYRNPTGEWLGCKPIVEAWVKMFSPRNALDVGCGRGTFVAYMRDAGIEAIGFDFSEWAIGPGRYPRCRPEWLVLHDATKPWPWGDRSFDLVTALDFLEHIYIDDLDFVLRELFRVAGRWVFLQIAIVGGGSGTGIHEKGYVIRKGERPPLELEANAVAGHVTVMPRQWWEEKLQEVGEAFIFRWDMVEWFKQLVPEQVIANWLKNLIVVMERVD